jgi:hypothetical protein
VAPNPSESGADGADDALALFRAEENRPSPFSSDDQGTTRLTESLSAASGITGALPIQSPASVVSGDAQGAVSLARVVDAAPLRFVDGIAVIQAVSAAVQTKGGRTADMPDLRGVFLKDSGDVVVMGSTTGEPATRELARLLHRLVPSDSTPPVGRLFIDRWTGGESSDLQEFTSELSYFARPNGRDLLAAVYARCSGGSQALPPVSPALVPTPRERAEPDPPPRIPESPPREAALISWLRSHRRQIVAASAMVVAAIVTTAVATWFWTADPAEAAAATVQNRQEQSLKRDAAKPNRAAGTTAATSRLAERASSQRELKPVPSRRLTDSGSRTPPVLAEQQATDEPSANLPSRVVADMRIYSATDAGVEPPILRSAPIPEVIIAGYPTKTNVVELIVGERGDVERVRMIGPPQRIPDIMLLSRVKEWMFAPATKNGTAVRYRLVLSWNVTP